MFIALDNHKTHRITIHAAGCQHQNLSYMEAYGYRGDDAAALATTVDADMENAVGFTTLAPCAKKA